tara:strand:+ start:1311 stop:1658 length:348 start_codon:yes stop_codon:yes gene_type:complete
MEGEFVYVNDVAEFMDVDRKTVYRWIQAEVIPTPSKIGGKTFRWSRSTIDKWVQTQEGLGHVNFTNPSKSQDDGPDNFSTSNESLQEVGQTYQPQEEGFGNRDFFPRSNSGGVST